MVIVVRNPIARLFLFLLPLIIFAIVYFTMIKPSTDTANDILRQNGTSISEQRQLADCLAGAGGKLENVQACNARYGP